VHVATDEEARARRAEITTLLAHTPSVLRQPTVVGASLWSREIAGIGASAASLAIWSVLEDGDRPSPAAIVGSPLMIIVASRSGHLAVRSYVRAIVRPEAHRVRRTIPDNLDRARIGSPRRARLVGALSVAIVDAGEPRG